MRKTFKKALALICAAAMTVSTFSPALQSQAATFSTGDEYITTANGLSVKITTIFNGESGKGVIAGMEQTSAGYGSSTADLADLVDGDINTGVIFRGSLSDYDDWMAAGDYIQVEFENPISMKGVSFNFSPSSTTDVYNDSVVSYTTDGSEWIELASVPKAQTMAYHTDDAIPNVKAVRLTNTVGAKAWVRLMEINVDAEGVAAVLTGLHVAAPTKTNYYTGEELDTTGMVVTGTYSDGTESEIAVEDCEITGFDSTSVGTQTVTVAYGEKTVTFTVNVVEAGSATDDRNDIDPKTMTVTAGSEEPSRGLPNEGPVSLAFDDDTDTYWHSSWTCPYDVNDYLTEMPKYFWVQMMFKEATVVDAVRYLSRGDGNGDITGYRIEGTADGETWTELTSGSWEYGGSWKIATFDAVELLGVRLVATQTTSSSINQVNNNQFANAKEIRVRMGELEVVPVNKSFLLAVIDAASMVDEESYTTTSWTYLQSKIAEAEAVYYDEDATQEEVDAAAETLQNAISALVYAANKTALQEVIDTANELAGDLYTDSSWGLLIEKLEEAVEVYENGDATQDEVDAAATALQDAIDALVALADKQVLAECIGSTDVLIEEVYTESSWEALQDALEEAVEVYENGDATQEEVDAVAEALQEAIDNLEYLGADYTSVEAALKTVPEDLSVYTDETVDALQAAIDAVDYDKNITEQDEVDAMATAIEEAVEALEYLEADYLPLEDAMADIPEDLSVYTEDTVNALQAAIDAVVYGKNITEQAEVNAMADAIAAALEALEYKAADYAAVEAALAKVPEDLSVYTEDTAAAVNEAVAAVDYDKNITEQAEVDAMAAAIEAAVAALEYLEADYLPLEDAMADIPEDLSVYTEDTVNALQAAIDAVVYGKKITEQAEVNAMADAIAAAVEALEYKAADYTAVEAALAKVPEDLSAYTAETVAVLEAAVAAVNYDKNITEQAEVDAMAAAIEAAVAGLVELPVDPNGMVAYYTFDVEDDTTVLVDELNKANGTIAESATFVAGKFGKAMSVNVTAEGAVVTDDITKYDNADWSVSYWVKTTSDFNKEISVIEDATQNYSLSLKMAAKGVDGFTTERSSGFRVGNGNGDVLTAAYNFEKDTWYHIVWTQDKDSAGVTMYVNGVVVQVNSGATNNNWTANNDIKAPIEVIGGTGFTGLIDEVRVYSKTLTAEEVAELAKEPVDKTALEAAIAAVPADVEMYTEDSWSAVETALFAANAVLADEEATQEAVDTATETLNAAVEALEYKAADYTAVEAALETVPEDLSVYTDETVDALQAAIDAVDYDKNITEQDEVDAMADAILAAVGALEYKAADYTAVEAALAKVPEDLSIYSGETLDVLLAAIDAVDYGKNITEQDDVDAMATAIEEAVEALEYLEADYLPLEDAMADIPEDLSVYTEDTVNALQAAIDAVVYGKKITEQAEVNAMADAIAAALEALEYKAADYTAVEAALAKVPEDLSVYTEDTAAAVNEAVAAVDYDKNITEQSEVDAMAAAIEAAVAALVKKEVCEVFSDVEHDAWYEGAVQYVYDNGIMSGNEGLFNPTNNITRAQIVMTLYNLEGNPEVTDYSAVEKLTDVQADQWYTDAVCWAYNTGITTGNDVTKMFGMDDNVTRQQLATFFYRYAEYKGFDVSATVDISGMMGADGIAAYAEKQMVWAVATGLIKGSEILTEAGELTRDLNPVGTATRAQVATMIQRFSEGNNLR